MMPVWQIPPLESTCKGASTSNHHQLDLCLVWDEPKTIQNDSEWEKIAMRSILELSLVRKPPFLKITKSIWTFGNWTLDNWIPDIWSSRQLIFWTSELLDNWSFRQLIFEQLIFEQHNLWYFWTTDLLDIWTFRQLNFWITDRQLIFKQLIFRTTDLRTTDLRATELVSFWTTEVRSQKVQLSKRSVV